jgi:glucan phosphoethanolaminetransferase (alkaline phosphatase superfamily)
MNKLNNFLETASAFKLYFFGWLTATSVVTLMFYIITNVFLTNSFLSFESCLLTGSVLGLVYALVIMFAILKMRKSDDFWKYAKVVEELIENAKTQYELEVIVDNEFHLLVGKSTGKLQFSELRRLYAIMKTKYKFVD